MSQKLSSPARTFLYFYWTLLSLYVVNSSFSHLPLRFLRPTPTNNFRPRIVDRRKGSLDEYRLRDKTPQSGKRRRNSSGTDLYIFTAFYIFSGFKWKWHLFHLSIVYPLVFEAYPFPYGFKAGFFLAGLGSHKDPAPAPDYWLRLAKYSFPR